MKEINKQTAYVARQTEGGGRRITVCLSGLANKKLKAICEARKESSQEAINRIILELKQ